MLYTSCIFITGKIKDLFPEKSLGSSVSLILVNAIYFKGQWKKKFKEDKTRLAPFYITKVNRKLPIFTHKIIPLYLK